MKLKFRNTPYPTAEELKPFINSHQKISNASNDELKHTPLDALSSRVPSNLESIKASEQFRKDLPEYLKGKMTSVKDFFLKDVTPYLLATSNALQDTADILELTFEEPADTAALFAKVENAIGLAMDVKILNFAKNFVGLDAYEAQQFLLMAYSKELKSSESIASIMHALQSLGEVPDLKKPIKQLKGNKVKAKPTAAAKKEQAKVKRQSRLAK